MATGHGGQHITAQKIIGAGLGLAGVLVTIGVESLRDFNTAAPLAQAAVLGASLCYTLAPMRGQRFSALAPAVTAAGAMSCAALMLLPSALIVERPWTLVPAPEAIAAVIVLAVLCTAIANIIYVRLVNPWGTWNHQRQLPSRRLFSGARHPLSRRKLRLVDFCRNGADRSRRRRGDRD
jgi:drug/metabolite transporter (DMT)-like permease